MSPRPLEIDDRDSDSDRDSPVLAKRSSLLSSTSARKKRTIVDESDDSDEPKAEESTRPLTEKDDSDFEPLPSEFAPPRAFDADEDEHEPTRTVAAPLSELQPFASTTAKSNQRNLPTAESDDEDTPHRSTVKKRKIVISDSEDSD
uniref:Uncharacterized protein n=1 Tax=Plectus sambesii TaxID=2011161 RepID=A0A914XAH9_9BILA